MGFENSKLYGEVHQDQQDAIANDTNGPVGMSRRGKLHVADHGKPAYGLAEQGQYFVATNPTAGTGIAGFAAADGINDLQNTLSVFNRNSAASGKRIYFDFLTVMVTAAGANGTDLAYVMHTDTVTRYTSGGSAITPVCTNASAEEESGARIHFGALVSPEASAQRLISGGVMRVVIGVVGDIFNFNFGGSGETSAQGILEATATVCMNFAVPPVSIGPGDSFLWQTNATSQSAGISWEFQLGYWVA